jgi:hypothetical protein
VNCHVFIATCARARKALDHCNPKHKLSVVVSSLVAHLIPVCLFVWVFSQIKVAASLGSCPVWLMYLYIYNN